MRRLGIVLVVFLVAFFSLSTSFAELYEVQAEIRGPFITPYYAINGTGLTVKNNVPHVWVDTQGDCYWSWSHYNEARWVCRHERGFYPLPAHSIVWDGERRIKYIGNNKNLTLARKSSFPVFGKYKMRDYVNIAVSDNHTRVTVLIQD